MTAPFESYVCSPWALVRYQGGLRLAFITSMAGTMLGPITGYRGHLMSDHGSPTDDSEENRWFDPGTVLKDWMVRPSIQNLRKAKVRHG